MATKKPKKATKSHSTKRLRKAKKLEANKPLIGSGGLSGGTIRRSF